MASRRIRSEFDGKVAGLYDLEETIGKGHFATVKLAKHVFTGERVAVKVIDKTKLDDISKSHLFQEVRCMKLVQHPHVVRLYEVIDTQTKLYLILELGDGGDMYDYIMKHDKGLEETIARRYFKQIVEAISYCHKLHVVHRDLKPENVVFFEKLGVVKLTDFGFSNMFNPGKKLETSCGSLAYSAPEILLGDSYDAPAVDVWSLGVILFMLVCGRAPFQEANDSETLTMIMDCKFKIPHYVSNECTELINKMLKRDPTHRATLQEIVDHKWLMMGSHQTVTIPMPLISREHLSEDDHNYLVDKMVEGNIASKDEILSSLEKDLYNHLAATYYLLAERRLKRQHLEVQHAQMSHPRKHSAPPGHGKPHLEPLSLSPRKQYEIKKTKTAPLRTGVFKRQQQQQIPIFEIPASPPIVESNPNYFIKSISGTMTLDRKAKKNSKDNKKDKSGSISPGTQSRKFTPTLGPIQDNVPQIHTELVKDNAKVANKKPFTPLSKIQILKSFFEKKVAAFAGKSTAPHRRSTGLYLKLPGGHDRMKKMDNDDDSDSDDDPLFPRVKPRGVSADIYDELEEPCERIQAKDREQKEDQKRPKTSIVQSLVSPPGTHPSPSSSPKHSLSPERYSHVQRKYSLIQEESLEDDDDDDMDAEDYGDLRSAKSAESLDDSAVHRSQCSPPTFEMLSLKRPLVSVASSPQLLNQICEEHESDEEDDIVPSKLHSPRLRLSRNSATSPEIIRKYGQRRKRRGAGSRGASCSSSDASDTDDTEGRSRKDKIIKHKFMHRRDSSDHSSDTDGGPPGPTGGSRGGGPGLGGGHSKDSHGRDKKGGGGGGNNGGKGHRDGKGGSGGSQGSKQNSNNNQLRVLANNRHGENAINSAFSNLSLSSINSKNSLKYIVEKSECEDDDDDDEGITMKSTTNSNTDSLNNNNNIDKPTEVIVTDKENNTLLNVNTGPICSTNGCVLLNGKENIHGGQKYRFKMDINRNSSSCKVENSRIHNMKIETKCCSLV